MRAIVIGGTGATGMPLVSQLLADKDITAVVSLVRNPSREPHEKLNEVKVDFENLQDYADIIYGDLAFSCLGTTLKDAGGKKEQWHIDYDYVHAFAQIAKGNEVPTFVLLSAQGADANAFFFYSKLKGKLEDAIKKLDFEHLVIARPSMLIRPNSKRMGERIGVVMLNFFNKLDLFKKQQPLHVEKVAYALRIAGKSVLEVVEIIGVKDILALNK
ncbi:NAD(P)H-binding protein [Flavobacteriaceae bacterium Ap0902]|nr:NAD(P)H-binding protein [Flavobacteriaceae bacterium Ap0902]